MKNHRLLACALAVAIAFIGWLIYSLLPHEPVFQGRRLGAWVADLHPHKSEEQQRQAEIALRAIGPDAVPYLLKLLQQKEPPLREELREVSWKTKRFLGIESVYELPWVEVVEREMHLIAAFSALGPAAKPAIPALTRLLHQPHTAYVAAWALARIGPQAVTSLVQALDSPHAEVRAAAVGVLGTIESGKETILPVLGKRLHDPDARVRIGAVASLGAIGRSEPQAVLSALITGRWRFQRSGAHLCCRCARQAWKRSPGGDSRTPETGGRAGSDRQRQSPGCNQEDRSRDSCKVGGEVSGAGSATIVGQSRRLRAIGLPKICVPSWSVRG